jgi:hypothetical protein
MSMPRSLGIRIVSVFALTLWMAASAQPRVGGNAELLVPAPADVVAEARGGFAWFPFEVGRGQVGSDGSFELEFRVGVRLPDDVTTPVEHLLDARRCEEVTVSDPAARVVVVRELRLIPRDAACEYCETLGTMYLATRDRTSLGATGDLAVQWIHADRDVSVHGRCRHGWGEETFVLELQEGWNTVVIETTAVIPSEGFCDCRLVSISVVTSTPETVAWHVVPTR